MNRISRRSFPGQVTGAAIATSLPQTLSAENAPTNGRKPNVHFFFSDDMRVEPGCHDSMFGAITPNLDALAKAGVRFDRNYCQYPLCDPSRASLMTGLHPTATGVLGNRTDFRTAHPDWTSLPQLFRENGYVSPRAGKIFHAASTTRKRGPRAAACAKAMAARAAHARDSTRGRTGCA